MTFWISLTCSDFKRVSGDYSERFRRKAQHLSRGSRFVDASRRCLLSTKINSALFAGTVWWRGWRKNIRGPAIVSKSVASIKDHQKSVWRAVKMNEMCHWKSSHSFYGSLMGHVRRRTLRAWTEIKWTSKSEMGEKLSRRLTWPESQLDCEHGNLRFYVQIPKPLWWLEVHLDINLRPNVPRSCFVTTTNRNRSVPALFAVSHRASDKNTEFNQNEKWTRGVTQKIQIKSARQIAWRVPWHRQFIPIRYVTREMKMHGFVVVSAKRLRNSH